MTRSPQADHLLKRADATPDQAAAWRRLRDLFQRGLIGGPCDGLRLHWLTYLRWYWKYRRDR